MLSRGITIYHMCVCVRARACIILDGHIDIQCSRQMEKACSEFMYI